MKAMDEIRMKQQAYALNDALHSKNDEIDILKDALRTLLQSYQADFLTITGAKLNDTEAVIKAKKALGISPTLKERYDNDVWGGGKQ